VTDLQRHNLLILAEFGWHLIKIKIHVMTHIVIIIAFGQVHALCLSYSYHIFNDKIFIIAEY
jgi:hypothetical protein